MRVVGERLRHGDHSNRASLIQRCSCARRSHSHQPCAQCESRKRRRLSRHGFGHVDLDDTVKQRVLAVLKGQGQPLSGPVRDVMEQALGAPFADVRVHRDSEAAQTASMVSASAYTVGPHIVFAEGQYAPHTVAGLQLLAHELTHVVQQRGYAESAVEDLIVGPEDDVLERDAREAATRLGRGQRTAVSGRSAASPGQALLQREKKVCGPNVTNQIAYIWSKIGTDFAGWHPLRKFGVCQGLIAPIKASMELNRDAFDVLPLYYKGANAWLMRSEVLDTPCGIPAPDPNGKWTLDEVESRQRCSLTVAVGDQCWLSGTVNYGTYGTMMRLCNREFDKGHQNLYPVTKFEYANGERWIHAYKAYGRSNKEFDVNEPLSWYKATYWGGPSAKPSRSGNRAGCDASGTECTLDGSIVNWDYVWEQAKPRSGAQQVVLNLKAKPKAGPLDWAVGWWKVWDGNTYYYYFFGDNDVIYINSAPNKSWKPSRSTGRRGRVQPLEHGMKVIWPPFSDEEATEETFTRMNWSSGDEMHATSTKYSPLGAKKL